MHEVPCNHTMAFYSLEPNVNTLHGAFSRDIAPTLTIDPGDTVRFQTLDAGWNLEPRRSTRHEDQPRKFAPRPPGQETGHALTGPIAIRGAEPGMTLGMPRAYTPAGWIAFGLDADLNEAALLALEGMVDLMTMLHGLDRHQALGMASVLVDLRVTQIVNQVKGVHALLPHGAL